MARGRKTSLTITLTPEERQTLLAWQRSTTIRSGLLRRARLILLLADGVAITTIAAMVGISRRFVYEWAQRFLAQGVDGLADKPGRGRVPRQATPAGAARHGAVPGSCETARGASKA
jgi:Helix-turn-helix domain